MTTPEEQATLSKLRAGTHVVVPVEIPDHAYDDAFRMLRNRFGRLLPKRILTAIYHTMIAAPQEDG